MMMRTLEKQSKCLWRHCSGNLLLVGWKDEVLSLWRQYDLLFLMGAVFCSIRLFLRCSCNDPTGARNRHCKFDQIPERCHAVWHHILTGTGFWSRIERCFISVPVRSRSGLHWLVDGFVYVHCFQCFEIRINLGFKEFATHYASREFRSFYWLHFFTDIAALAILLA